MAGASNLFPSIATDVFQLYLWHFWQYVCKHKAFSDLASCHLAQEPSCVTLVSAVIRRGEEGSSASLVLDLACSSLYAKGQTFLVHCPLGKWKPPSSRGRNIGRKQGNSPTWGRASHLGHLGPQCSGGGRCSRKSCTHLAWTWASGTDKHTLSRHSSETLIQILSPISRWTAVNFLGSPRPVAFLHCEQRPINKRNSSHRDWVHTCLLNWNKSLRKEKNVSREKSPYNKWCTLIFSARSASLFFNL